MLTSACALRGLEGHVRTAGFHNQRKQRSSSPREADRTISTIGAVIVVEFRDEVFASIAHLLNQYGLTTHRAKSSSELASMVVRHQAELIVLNGTQPDESAWLTSAKLRIIDAYRYVWIYTPKKPSALDEWLSMAGVDDIIVYGGVLHSLIESLQQRLLPRTTAVGRKTEPSRDRMPA